MKRGVLRQIAELEDLDLNGLRERWRELNGTEPPGYSRAMLKGRLAYRIQELAFGGLSEATRAELRGYVDDAGDSAKVSRLKRRNGNNGKPATGTRIVREWRGKRYEVTALDSGYELDGRRYRTLSAVAKAITGQHMSGPAFFGLSKSKKK